jgi:endoglucanase
MKFRNTIPPIILTLTLFLSACTLQKTLVDKYVSIDAYEMNQRLGRGVNLGNALDAPEEGSWGVILEEGYFQLIADRGFDSVRIPIRWSAHASRSNPFMITADFFDRVDWAVENALSRDLAVVINFHHYEDIFADPDGERERFLALWRQVADHYQDAQAIIRETNPDRIVIVGPPKWNAVHQLSYLDLPEDDRNIIVTFHYYEPFKFTHQGAEWSEGSDAWLGRTWEGTESQKRSVTRDMDTAAAWGERYDRPIYLGEFGAYSKAEMNSRTNWTSFVVQSSEERGFSWAYWEFCAGFGIYDPIREVWRAPLVDSLLPEE